MRIIKKIFSLVILKVVMITNLFGFDISSPYFAQRIDTGGYKEYTLKNRGEQTIRYKIEVKKSESGADMSEWINIYPKVMTIPPFESRTLKVYAQSPLGTSKGEYGFRLIVTPLNVPVIKEESKKIEVNASIDFVPVIQMYGYVGDPKFAENIILKDNKFVKDSKTGLIKYSASVENKSFAGLELGIKFVINNDAIVDGKYIGRIKAKSGLNKIECNLSKSIKKPYEVKKLIIYDATNLINIKTIDLREKKS